MRSGHSQGQKLRVYSVTIARVEEELGLHGPIIFPKMKIDPPARALRRP